MKVADVYRRRKFLCSMPSPRLRPFQYIGWTQTAVAVQGRIGKFRWTYSNSQVPRLFQKNKTIKHT